VSAVDAKVTPRIRGENIAFVAFLAFSFPNLCGTVLPGQTHMRAGVSLCAYRGWLESKPFSHAPDILNPNV